MLAAANPAQPPWQLSEEGFGPVRIGMSAPEAAQALATDLKGEPIESGEICVEKVAANFPGVRFMFENGRLTRISVAKASPVTSQRAIAVGATAAQVRGAYGSQLVVEPHKHQPPPAEYLTYWALPKKRGIRFEVSTDRRVYVMHAENDSVTCVPSADTYFGRDKAILAQCARIANAHRTPALATPQDRRLVSTPRWGRHSANLCSPSK